MQGGSSTRIIQKPTNLKKYIFQNIIMNHLVSTAKEALPQCPSAASSPHRYLLPVNNKFESKEVKSTTYDWQKRTTKQTNQDRSEPPKKFPLLVSHLI